MEKEILEKIEALEATLAVAKAETIKFIEKKNNAAGLRGRQKFVRVRNLANEIRHLSIKLDKTTKGNAQETA